MYKPGDYACVDMVFPVWKLWDWVPNRLIKSFTHSIYSHAFVIVSEAGDIVEAMPRGAQLSHISKYAGFKLQFSTTELTAEQRTDIVNNAVSYIGTPYNFEDIFYLGMYTQGFQWDWLLKKIMNDKKLICSQLVATAGTRARNPVTSWLCGKPDAQLVTPADLAILAQNGG